MRPCPVEVKTTAPHYGIGLTRVGKQQIMVQQTMVTIFLTIIRIKTINRGVVSIDMALALRLHSIRLMH
jgi:hypothetical protein